MSYIHTILTIWPNYSYEKPRQAEIIKFHLVKSKLLNGHPESHCEEIMEKKHPWTAPGTASIHGEGCGVNGGNPQGCWEDDQLPYGHCCTYQSNCGGNYAYGKSAMEHAAEGLFIDAATTTWKRGEPAPVIFVSHAHHWGMYVI